MTSSSSLFETPPVYLKCARCNVDFQDPYMTGSGCFKIKCSNNRDHEAHYMREKDDPNWKSYWVHWKVFM
jgi:hypothetical protein